MKKMIKMFLSIGVSLILLTSVVITVLNQTKIPGLFIGYQVLVKDSYAYVSTNDGVIIFNLKNPNHPVKEGIIEISDGAFDCIKENDILYIAGDDNGLVIANVSNPKKPIKLSETPLNGAAISSDYDNFLVYVLSTSREVNIFNITNPTSPELINCHSLSQGDYRDLILQEDILYIADATRGIEVINVSNPLNLIVINEISCYAAITLHKYENYLFSGCHGNGIRAFDVSNPLLEYSIFTYQEPGGEAYGVYGNKTHLYVADLQKGTYLLDVSDTTNIKKIRHYYEATPHDVHGDSKYICLGDQDRRIIVFDLNLNTLYKGHKMSIGYELPILMSFGVIILFLYFKFSQKEVKRHD